MAEPSAYALSRVDSWAFAAPNGRSVYGLLVHSLHRNTRRVCAITCQVSELLDIDLGEASLSASTGCSVVLGGPSEATCVARGATGFQSCPVSGPGNGREQAGWDDTCNAGCLRRYGHVASSG